MLAVVTTYCAMKEYHDFSTIRGGVCDKYMCRNGIDGAYVRLDVDEAYGFVISNPRLALVCGVGKRDCTVGLTDVWNAEFVT